MMSDPEGSDRKLLDLVARSGELSNARQASANADPLSLVGRG